MRPWLTLALALVASPAFAQQHTELSLLAGWTSSSDIEQKARGIEGLELESGFTTWVFTAGRFFSPRLGVEVSFAEQDTEIVIATSAGSADLFDVTLQQVHANFVYAFAREGGTLTPFVFAGLGAAFLDASETDAETKFAWGLGAGLKWFPGSTFGARVQARYVPTRLDDAASDICDPFGFCQGSFQQFELTGGISIRF
jgi:opacity protein-like surface antigen